ncbi:hypothetical protein [Streptomyces sp. NPDC093109]|uniref:hypothetical protein n=1 Tax=Streptomyces sp. NPDC093109 TaxID=3154977 RepID=UPI003450E002
MDGRQVTPPGRRPASPDAVRADAVYLATLRSLAALDSDLARDAAADLGSAYRRRYGPLPYPAPSSAPAPDPAPAPDGPPPPSGIGPPTPPPEGGDTVERA